MIVSFARVEGAITDGVKLRRNQAGLGIQYKRNIGCMIRRVAQEDSNSSSICPFVVRVFCLKACLKDIDWRSENGRDLALLRLRPSEDRRIFVFGQG